MLVARRDPPFHADPPNSAPAGYPAVKASGLARFLTAIQLFGSILAVPVGIASAYSFYRANFSPETTCQSLRSGIVAMLDKSVDASTRRILVRRDVEAFEKACASVDPDATAAFKTLLDDEKASPPVAAAPVPKVQHTDTPPKDVARKPEPRPQTIAKQPAPSAPATESARRDAPVSDTQWLDAVRQALVKHKAEVPAAPNVAVAPKASEQPVKAQAPLETAAHPVAHEAALPASAPPPAPPSVSTATPAAPALSPPIATAPALPPPIAIAPPPAQQVDADHPVPPGSIPDSVQQAENPDAAKPDGQGRSRIRKWISEIPLLGSVVENGRQ